ncbi:MAG: adenosylcobinamide-GDP ribazoletransferase [Lachnospiraceae bacterium]|nr:adenosylcobinamide-GDP ribazoletransferase [Lachnospiraceae bacterium]
MAEIIILGVLAMIGAYFMVFFNASVGLACVVGALLTFLYYWLVTHKHFGGITEDSAGFFLQLCEIIIPLAALLAYKKWW